MNIDGKFDVRISTKHIVRGDVFFCFKEAEKYIADDIFEKSSKIYAENGFFNRVCNIVNGKALNENKSKIIEIGDGIKLHNKLVEELKKRYKIPSKLLAITGTKGKTSTSWFVLQLLSKCGIKCGYIGTIGAYIDIGKGIEKLNKEDTLTTPAIDDLYRFLDKMHSVGVEAVVFEASSHSLQQGRIDGLEIDIAGFTNLSQDHLDYHKTMDDYFNSKCLLFSKYLKNDGFAVINVDDKRCNGILNICSKNIINSGNIITFGAKCNTNYRIIKTKQKPDFQTIKIEYNGKKYNLRTRIIGDFQAHNIVMAMIFAEKCYNNIIDNNSNIFDKIVNFVSELQAPLGRMQRVFDTNIFIDYAHTPKSLQEGLLLLNGLYKRVIVVFGCGGDRDKKKRPLMLEISKRIAKDVIITNDNPRTESDIDIINDITCFYNNKQEENDLLKDDFVLNEMNNIKQNFKKIKCKKSIIEKDRQKAIEIAIKLYKNSRNIKKTAVLIAGKGHEDYQIIGTEKRHFSDYEEVLKVLQNTK